MNGVEREALAAKYGIVQSLDRAMGKQEEGESGSVGPSEPQKVRSRRP